MPAQFTTVLPDSQQPTLGGIEDEVSYTIPDDTNNGDYRIQIRETGQTAWDGTATGFAEDVVSSDGDTSGTIGGVFTGREDGEEYEVRARTETDDVTGDWTTPVSVITVFPAVDNLTLTVDSSTQLTANWTDNADNEDGQRVYLAEELDRRADTGYGAFEEVADLAPNIESYVLDGLEKNTGYKVYIEAYTEHSTAQSATVTESTGPDLTLSQSLTIGESTNRIQLAPDELVAKDLAKVHTGVGDARVSVPELDVLIPGVQRQDRVNYYIDGDCEWTGYAVGYQGDDLSGRWELRVDGVGKRLEETRPDYASLGGPLVYTNTALHDAIRDYWGRTPFNATVTDQQTEIVAQDEELQAADTTTEWGNTTTIADDVPAQVTSGTLAATVGSQPRDFLADDTDSANVSFTDDDALNAGQAFYFTDSTQYVEVEVTFDHRIPAESVGIQIRDRVYNSSEVDYLWDGTVFDTNRASGKSLDWFNIGDGSYGGDGYETAIGADIQPGTTYTLRVEGVGPSDYEADVIAVYDQRYNFNFPNPDAATNAGGFLSGPEVYPDAVEVLTDDTTTAYNIESGSLTSTWDDTSNNQQIELSNDGGATFPLSASNSTSVSGPFSDDGRTAKVRFTLSRYGSGRSAFPTDGYNGQSIDLFSYTGDLNDLVVIDRLELSRDHFANLKSLHDYGDFLWVIEHDSGDLDTLTVRSFNRGAETRTAPFAFLNPANRSPEVAAENYFNSVYLEGALQSDGTRPTAEVKDQDAINADGREITPGVLRDQNISTEAGATFRANALLEAALENDALRGTIDTHPVYVEPGYGYSIDFGQGSEIKTLESLSITESAGDVGATAEFVTREQLSETISNLKREGRTLGNEV